MAGSLRTSPKPKRKPGKLKIAFTAESPIGTVVHPECIKAVSDAARLLEKLGHYVDETGPDYSGKDLAASYLTMYLGEIAADIDMVEDLTGEKPSRDNFEITTWILGMLGRLNSASDFG